MLSAIKEYQKWSIGQLNIQTLSDDIKLDLTLQECHRANLDVICFQEVRRLNTGSLTHHGFSFYWSGLRRHKKHGVAIAIRKCNYITIESIHNINARIMAIDLMVRGFKVRVISCYAPTLYTSLSTKQSFYKDLSMLSKADGKRKVIIQGDFNAEFQISRTHSCFDGSRSNSEEGMNQTNENCMLYLQYCQNNNLCILNTWYDHPLHHRVTWHHPDSTTKKVYDYSLCRSWLKRFILDVRVRNSYFNSDHRLLVTKLQTPTNKASRFIKRKVTKPNPKLNLDLLKNNEIAQKVSDEILKYLDRNECPQSIDSIHTHLLEALNKGREVIPKQVSKQQIIPWQQDQILTDLNAKRIQLPKQPETIQTKHELKQIHKQVKKRTKEVSNKMLEIKGKELNELKQQHKIARLWKQAKQHESLIHSKTRQIQCLGLADHFKKHFSPDHSALPMPLEIENPPEFIQMLKNPNLNINNSPPSQEEISTAIKQLNKGKSSIDIEAEIIKHADSIESFKHLMEQYFNKIWTQKQIPTQWRISRITPIWKRKGSALDPSKYRGISTGSIMSKIGMNIILRRLSKFYEEQLKRSQFGFRQGVGCNDAIYVAKQLQEIAYTADKSLYACFVDLTAAFDHVKRDFLFKTIRNRLTASQATTNIDLIENLYSSTKSYLQKDDPSTKCFNTKSGVRQGGMEGPPLYNFYSDYALRVYEDRKLNDGLLGLAIPYNIPNEATNRTQRSEASPSGICNEDEEAYADDLGIFSWSLDELNRNIKILHQVFTEFGLNINVDKTETMIFNWDASNTNEYPQSIIAINGKKINNVTTFKYLGVWLTYNNINVGITEIEHRINSAFSAFAANKKLFTNKNIKLQTRVQFLNSLVRSRLVYGCHAWRPTSSELSKIDSTYRYMLRSMLYNGHTRVNPPTASDNNSQNSSDEEDPSETEQYDYRYVINNERLHQITNTESITNFFEKQQMYWISHVIRRNNLNLCKILTFHSVKPKRLGRRTKSILQRVVDKSGLTMNEFLKVSFMKMNR